MTRISTVDAKARISEMINRVAYGGERLVIQRRGKDLVALVPLEDYLALHGETEEAPQKIQAVQVAPPPAKAKPLIDPPIQKVNVQVELEEEVIEVEDDEMEISLL